MPVEGKDELDAVAFLARGCVISTMGQLHFKRLIEDKAIVHVFRNEDILLPNPVPGFRYRMPEFRIDWDWDPVKREYQAVQYAVHAEGLLNLGKGRIEAPRSLDEINAAIPKWIDNETLANEVAFDIARTLGTGLILWQFTSTYRYPELEIGDKVAVGTRLFVAKDPNSGRVLKGQLYAVGTIMSMHPDGRQFAVWVQGFGDLFTTAEAVVRENRLLRVVQIESKAFQALADDPLNFQPGYVEPAGFAGADHELGADVTSVHVRPGSCITGFDVRARYLTGLGTGVFAVSLLRVEDDGTTTNLGTLNLTADANWQTASHTLATPEEVGDYSSASYALEVQMRPSENLSDTRLAWVNILYKAPHGQ